ncbi:phosphatase PAP2 family protein [Nocardia sp. CA-107356]|uniref:phosphatase PAP2 family protein n=1 Tax=Nocardia sp. CA-107356 TaxID=3239972 RepID=UPI003D8E7B99
MGFDEGIMRVIAETRQDAVTRAIRTIGDAGVGIEVLGLLALVGVMAVVVTRSWRVGAAASASLLLADFIAHNLKQAIGRPRPSGDLTVWPEIQGWAMPSTHAAATSALALAVFLAVDWESARTRRAAGAALAAAVVFIGGCMVYLGAHWPTDVLIGWLLGTAVGTAVTWVTRRVRPRTSPMRA